MDIEAEIKLNAEYKRITQKYNKYKINGMDVVYVCNSCGKRVWQADISRGIGCRRCMSMKVRPVMSNLTKFGIHYCRFWNWFWNKYHERNRPKEL